MTEDKEKQDDINGSKVVHIIENNDQTDIETHIKLGYLSLLSESQIISLLDRDELIFSNIILRWGTLDSTLSLMVEQFLEQKNEIISEYIRNKWIEAFKSANLEVLFRVWHKFWLGHCNEKDFLEIIENPEINFLQDLLLAFHHFGYKKDYYHDYVVVPLFPEKLEELTHKKLKNQVFKIARKNDIVYFGPLLGTHLLKYLDSEDIRKLIIDEGSGFFKNVIQILGGDQDELYYYDESFHIGKFGFFNICRSIENNILKSLIISVMIDEFISTYSSIIEEELIRTFSYLELTEILSSLPKNRFKAFINSIVEIVESSIWWYNDFETNESIQYIIKLEKFLTKPLKETIVDMILKSNFRKSSDLLLNLGKVGWFKQLELEQLKLILKLTNYHKNKSINKGDKADLGIIINDLKNLIKNFNDKSIPN